MVEIVGFCQVMWIVMLESAKDRVFGVDTPGQQVSPCVWYGMTCLLIRDVVESVPSSVEWEIGLLLALAHTVQEGSWYRCWCSYSSRPAIGNLSNAMVLRTTLAKLSIRLIVNLSNGV
jgi:hypothetical protein